MENWHHYDIENFPVVEVLAQFEERFAFLKGKPLVLNETASYAEILVTHGKKMGFSIVGLLDDKLVGHRVYGLPVIPPDQVPQYAEYIILTNNQAHLASAYQRLCFLEEAGVAIYTPDGTRMNRQERETEQGIFATKADIVEAIEHHSVVSFDIFDTLLVRRVVEPETAFYMLENKLEFEDFGKMRSNIREYFKQEFPRHLRLDEIYGYLKQFGPAGKDWDAVLQAEIELEKKITVVRREMQQLLQHARNKGKKVVLTTDMYYTSAMLQEILDGHGISGYDKIIVSCEVRRSKQRGTMWEALREAFPQETIMHVDDRTDFDPEPIAQARIDYYAIASPEKLLVNGGLAFLGEGKRTAGDEVALGSLATQVGNNPFAMENGGCLALETPYEVGYSIFGPITHLFMSWLLENTVKNREDVVLFLSRDGYCWESLYREMGKREKLPYFCYFYTSRMAAINAYVENIEDIQVVLHKTNKSRSLKVYEILKSFFQVDLEADDFNQQYYYRVSDEALLDYIEKNCLDLILEEAKEQRENYRTYVEGLNLPQGDKIAVVDFVGGGSAQMFLKRLLGRKLGGYYMGNRSGIGNKDGFIDGERTYSLYPDIIGYNDSPLGISAMVRLGEMVYTAPDNQLERFDNEGRPIFAPGTRNFTLSEHCQKGIRDYIKDMTDLGVEPCSLGMADKLLHLLTKKDLSWSESVRQLFTTPENDVNILNKPLVF